MSKRKSAAEEFGRDGKFYFCPYCEYRSESQRSLKRHVNGMHTHEVTYVCHQCGEVKYRKDDLRRHIARVHEGAPADRRVCPRCEMGFTAKEELFAHMHFKHKRKIHPNLLEGLDRARIFDIGPEAIRESEDLTKQTDGFGGDDAAIADAAVTESPKEKTHQGLHCPVCGACYDMASALRAHARTVHPLVAKFECKLCEFGSPDPFSVWRHGRRCRGDLRGESPGLRCHVCDSRFAHVDHLVQHLKILHQVSSTAAVSCRICTSGSASFHLTSSLQMHIYKVHLKQTLFR